MATRESLEKYSTSAVGGVVDALVAAIGNPRSASAGTQESVGALLVRQSLSGPKLVGSEFSSIPSRQRRILSGISGG